MTELGVSIELMADSAEGGIVANRGDFSTLMSFIESINS